MQKADEGSLRKETNAPQDLPQVWGHCLTSRPEGACTRLLRRGRPCMATEWDSLWGSDVVRSRPLPVSPPTSRSGPRMGIWHGHGPEAKASLHTWRHTHTLLSHPSPFLPLHLPPQSLYIPSTTII